MYNNEDRIGFNKMHEFSPVDGFLEITEDMADMTKFIANEPSMGLFYVQQHTRNAAPNLMNLKNKVAEKSHDTSLHTEDTEDSISTLRSMKDCGYPIVDDMIDEIKRSLTIISTKQPKKGLIFNPSSGVLRRNSSWSPSNWGRTTLYSEREDDKSTGYLSNVFKSAKQRGNNFKHPQVGASYRPAQESEDISLSGGEPEDGSRIDKSLSQQKLLSLYDSYEEFNAERESKLEEWLGRTDHKENHENLQGSSTGQDSAP